jgi:peroxiredoxin
MSKVPLNQKAPDFSATTFAGEDIKLSDYQGIKNVLLVFNRGFA